MKSLTELYKIGRGPSSSHTMGPERAAKHFENEHPDAAAYKVILYGSLALTGRGHGTDRILTSTFTKPCEVVWNVEETELPHPNTMDMYAYDGGGRQIGYHRVLSVGGGAIKVIGAPEIDPPEVYPLNTFEEIKQYCKDKEIRLSDYVAECEGDDIWDYLDTVWQQMKASVKEGLAASGTLPGGLDIQRKAKLLFNQRHIDESPETRENRMVCAYAFAVSEENAAGGTIVTAPTCGASGVIPAVMLYTQKRHNLSDEAVLRGLAAAGIIGNLIKTNASISGAECGCQAEIGSACAMAAAGLAELFEMDVEQIEYAAEVAIEHHLGLTCDPVCGLVQVPCIERNAVAAMRAINALSLANFLAYTRKISLDTIIATMYETGHDLKGGYRETSEAGLAKLYKKKAD